MEPSKCRTNRHALSSACSLSEQMTTASAQNEPALCLLPASGTRLPSACNLLFGIYVLCSQACMPVSLLQLLLTECWRRQELVHHITLAGSSIACHCARQETAQAECQTAFTAMCRPGVGRALWVLTPLSIPCEQGWTQAGSSSMAILWTMLLLLLSQAASGRHQPTCSILWHSA